MELSRPWVLLCDLSNVCVDALRRELGSNSISLSEAELLKLAYAQWRNTLPSHLDGEFAFVLHDTEQNLYLSARDSLGIKALYYTKKDKRYFFSTNINELFSLSKIKKQPNMRSMRTMLYGQKVDYTDTMYENIYRLPPGSSMTIQNGHDTTKRYWHPEKITINYKISEKDAANTLKELLTNAINKRIDTLDETAFELSGGLDSSSIVSILAQYSDPRRIASYSMDFGNLKCDEGEYIESILKRYSLKHHTIPSGHLDYTARYGLEALYTINPNWPITLTFAMLLPMLKAMKTDGEKVIITGQGGDHLFTGSKHLYFDLFRRWELIALFREIREYPRPWVQIKHHIIKPLLGGKLTSFLISLSGKRDRAPSRNDQAEIDDLSDLWSVSNPSVKHALDMVTSAAQSTVLDGSIFHAAEEYYGIEFRHPFFDRELVEFALSLPPEMKYRQRTIKWILRRAMDGILPDAIKDRGDKAEFSELIAQQINAIDLKTLLDDPHIVRLGLIDQGLVGKCRREFAEKKSGYTLFLWTIINVEYWYRYNFERESLGLQQ